MLARLEMKLQSEEKLDFNMSSLFQGALMEIVDKEYAACLHEQKLNPYAQHLEFRENEIIWVITALTDEAVKRILMPFMDVKVKEFKLEHKQMVIRILEKKLETEEYRSLLNRTFFSECSPYITITFITPTAFKVNGNYQFYPTVHHIFRSLLKKHDSISGNTEVFSDELIQQMDDSIEVIGYKLRSLRFHLEGTKIPAFVGSITLKIKGTAQFVNLVHMLAELGTYSGVGIKTALGMGAIRITDNQSRKERNSER